MSFRAIVFRINLKRAKRIIALKGFRKRRIMAASESKRKLFSKFDENQSSKTVDQRVDHEPELQLRIEMDSETISLLSLSRKMSRKQTSNPIKVPVAKIATQSSNRRTPSSLSKVLQTTIWWWKCGKLCSRCRWWTWWIIRTTRISKILKLLLLIRTTKSTTSAMETPKWMVSRVINQTDLPQTDARETRARKWRSAAAWVLVIHPRWWLKWVVIMCSTTKCLSPILLLFSRMSSLKECPNTTSKWPTTPIHRCKWEVTSTTTISSTRISSSHSRSRCPRIIRCPTILEVWATESLSTSLSSNGLELHLMKLPLWLFDANIDAINLLKLD